MIGWHGLPHWNARDHCDLGLGTGSRLGRVGATEDIGQETEPTSSDSIGAAMFNEGRHAGMGRKRRAKDSWAERRDCDDREDNGRATHRGEVA